ncbi:MAG: hypothetical protein H8E14_06405 [Candidatus Marinimicrobia bacterium]|nr:hypothetical protein [Candidatus Neomarinimicrobiota bacterium]
MYAKSDPSLISEVRNYGLFDAKACFQCGSCTLTCNLTSNAAAFPRRTFRFTIFGLRKHLLASLEPWLCYYCGDCSIACPRQTEPGEGMMTLRRFLTAYYDWTGLSKRIYRSRLWEIGSMVLVGLLVLLLGGYYHIQTVGLEYGDLISEEYITEIMAEGFMAHMFGLIKTFTILIFLFPVLILLINAFRMYWFTMHKGTEFKIPFSVYLTEAKTLVLHAVTQKRFKDCESNRRWLIHGLLVFGCVLMSVLVVFFLEWFQTDNIYPLYHPQRWLGYLATAALIIASVEIIIGRIRKRSETHKISDFSDWTLPVLLLLTAVSGIVLHIFRYLGYSFAVHFTYAIHLAITAPLLVIEIPFGKLSHMLYRPLAIYFNTVREKALQNELKGEID